MAELEHEVKAWHDGKGNEIGVVYTYLANGLSIRHCFALHSGEGFLPLCGLPVLMDAINCVTEFLNRSEDPEGNTWQPTLETLQSFPELTDAKTA